MSPSFAPTSREMYIGQGFLWRSRHHKQSSILVWQEAYTCRGYRTWLLGRQLQPPTHIDFLINIATNYSSICQVIELDHQASFRFRSTLLLSGISSGWSTMCTQACRQALRTPSVDFYKVLLQPHVPRPTVYRSVSHLRCIVTAFE